MDLDDSDSEEVAKLLLETGEVVEVGGSSAEVSNQGVSESQSSGPDGGVVEDPYNADTIEDYSMDHC